EGKEEARAEPQRRGEGEGNRHLLTDRGHRGQSGQENQADQALARPGRPGSSSLQPGYEWRSPQGADDPPGHGGDRLSDQLGGALDDPGTSASSAYPVSRVSQTPERTGTARAESIPRTDPSSPIPLTEPPTVINSGSLSAARSSLGPRRSAT